MPPEKSIVDHDREGCRGAEVFDLLPTGSLCAALCEGLARLEDRRGCLGMPPVTFIGPPDCEGVEGMVMCPQS